MLWILFLGMVFAGGLAAFDPYLEPGENVTVYNKTIVINESLKCVLHYFNEQPTFLVCNGKIVENRTQIEEILSTYARLELEQILNQTKQNLTELVLRFNESRFDGDTGFPGKEEQFCRLYLGEVIKDLYYTNPYNQKLYPDIYHYYQNYLCGTEIIECSYNMTLVPDLREFFETSYGLDENISLFLETLDQLDIYNLSEQYSLLLNLVKSFNESSQILAQTPFRFDRDCPTCYAVCPVIHTDLEAVAAMYDILLTYYSDPFLLNLPTIINQTYNNTLYRLAVKETNIILTTYKPQLDKLNREFNKLKEAFLNLTDYLYNQTLVKKFYDFEDWVNMTNQLAEQRNISGLTYYIKNALERLPTLNKSIQEHYQLYDELKKLEAKLKTYHFLYRRGYPEHLQDMKILELYNRTIELLQPPINASLIPLIYNNTERIMGEFQKPYETGPRSQRYIIELDVLTRPLERFIQDINMLKIVLAAVMGGIFASFAYVVGYWLKRVLVGRSALIVLLPISLLIGIVMAYYTYTTIIPTSPVQVMDLLRYLKENGSLVYDDPRLEVCAQQFNFTNVYFHNKSG
ncbi:MAG: hypothetical protein GXN92_00100 [Candidatus Micrarchaeota archaeon]|nr:hypothetical protein [Candidatus Micrarchaeota archaeon]